MELLAPAKINLSLDIVGRRPDGYHLLRTVMQSVSLCDVVALSSAGSGAAAVSCESDEFPCGDNTITRAAKFFLAAAGLPDEDGLQFTVKKRIPTQAGLGGGSADAAAALKLLNAFYGTGFSSEELCRIGLRVGADVPFCLTGGTALSEGIGEKLCMAPPLPPCFLVICRPKDGVGTGSAYEAFDRRCTQFPAGTDRLLEALYSGSLEEIGRNLSNAFAAAGISPATGAVCDAIRRFQAAGACMTGSGSAAFGLFSDRERACECQAYLDARYPYAVCCEPFPKVGCEEPAAR